MKRSRRLWPLAVGVALALVFGFFSVAHVIGVWHIPELWSQVFAACTGSMVVAVVTMVLMRGQRSSEEEKEKSIKIHESKVEVYSRFVAQMYRLLADDQMSCHDFTSLRTEIFSSLIFYLSDSNLRALHAELSGIRNLYDSTEMVAVFARITSILQDDLNGSSLRDANKERLLVDLWNRFGELSHCRR